MLRLVMLGGAVMALMGASYLSYYGVGGASRDLAADTQSIRTGSTGGNRGGVFAAFGRIK